MVSLKIPLTGIRSMKINPSGFGDVGLAHRFFGFALNMSEAGGVLCRTGG